LASPDSGVSFFPAIPVAAHAASHWHFPDLLLIAEILAAIILFGIVARLAIFSFGLLKLRQLRRTSAPFPIENESLPVLDQMRSLVSARAEFRLSAEVDSPVTFGFTAPVILLPERFPQLPPQFQSAIACHELLHVRRNDWVHHLAEEILRVAFWFHPAVLWLISRVRLAREQLVDLEVVRLTQARKTYLEALLEFTPSRSRIAAIPAPPFLVERQFGERVALMVKEVRMSRTRLLVSLSAIVCTLALAAVFAVSVFPLKAAPLPFSRSRLPRALHSIFPQNATPQQSIPATQPVISEKKIWPDTVKKGDMMINVRGLGTMALLNGQPIAKIEVGETQAVDIRAGQPAEVDTHKEILKGHVANISSQVVTGTRSVIIALDSPPPSDLGPQATVEGTVQVAKLEGVIYVGRPVKGRANQAGILYKIIDDGKEAQRVNVQFGRASVSEIQILNGLEPGDKIILTDMSPYDEFERVKINP